MDSLVAPSERRHRWVFLGSNIRRRSLDRIHHLNDLVRCAIVKLCLRQTVKPAEKVFMTCCSFTTRIYPVTIWSNTRIYDKVDSVTTIRPYHDGQELFLAVIRKSRRNFKLWEDSGRAKAPHNFTIRCLILRVKYKSYISWSSIGDFRSTLLI